MNRLVRYWGWSKYIANRVIRRTNLLPEPLQRLPGEQGNRYITSLVAKEEPCLIGRVGSTELRNLLYMRGIKFDPKAPHHLEIESGIFPGSMRTSDTFSDLMESAVREVDILISFGWRGEGYLRNILKNETIISHPRALEPYLIPGQGWWHQLSSKRVLVVNSFASFIKERITREVFENLWPKEKPYIDKILPLSIDCVNTPYGWEKNTRSRYGTYVDVFEDLKVEISNKDYDIALIACGGYGLPLAAWVKQQGKQAVHLGGVLQVWAGIKGKRFMTQKPWVDIDKTYWVDAPESTRPSSTEFAVGSYW